MNIQPLNFKRGHIFCEIILESAIQYLQFRQKYLSQCKHINTFEVIFFENLILQTYE